MAILPRRLIGYAVLAVLPVALACGGPTDPAPVKAAQQAPTASPAPPDPTSTTAPIATPAPEPSATPTASPAPSPTAQPGDRALDEGPLADLAARLSDDAWGFLVELTEEHSPRESATDDEAAAAKFLVERFEQIGYSASLQPFEFPLVATDVPVLTVAMDSPPELPGLPMSLSAERTATGRLVDVGLALAQDIPDEGLAGKVALIQRGEVTFNEKVSRVQEAGAIAAVIYNSRFGLFQGSLINASAIPAVSVSQDSGESLVALLAAGEVEVTVSVVIRTHSSRNVIAEKPGTDRDAGTVVVGAHFDTAPGTQGANDNGSGVSVLMTMAREIVDRSYPFTIQFVAFGSEEVGLFGSRRYVSALSGEEQDDLVAMLNFDVPGSGNFIEVQGDPGMANKVRSYGDVNGIRVIRGSLQGGGSDHEIFAALDIPVLFFFANDISRINSTADTIDFVNPRLLGPTVALGMFLLDDLAAGR